MDAVDSVVYCVECQDTPANKTCNQCENDPFCNLCFSWLHRTGNRASHQTAPIKGQEDRVNVGTTEYFVRRQNAGPTMTPEEAAAAADEEAERQAALSNQHANTVGAAVAWTPARAHWIPLRFSEEERALFHVLEGALEVSEYTDNVDVTNMYGWRYDYDGNSKRVEKELADILHIVSGLAICADWQNGSNLVEGRTLNANGEFFGRVFELGRRFKIMNPDKMRSNYGKLVWMLMDACQAFAQKRLSINLRIPIVSVEMYLQKHNAVDLLRDPLLPVAINPLPVATPEAKAIKATARQQLITRYAACCAAASDDEGAAPQPIGEAGIERCINSISDNASFIASNAGPVRRMMAIMMEHYTIDGPMDDRSLAIRNGVEGSHLSHSHATQFTFCLQTFQLWCEVVDNFFELWFLAEMDLCSGHYSLRDTGQGLNRVQPAPHIGQAMSKILNRVHNKCGSWIGLSVVHLGDRDVPNALVFIDKYTQVSRILAPVVHVLESVDRLFADPALHTYLAQEFHNAERLRYLILGDFLRHGFDGSGSDGGSCIDGRLTSAWNWCSKLEKKRYYHVFLLAGFQGFDGKF